MVAAQKIEDTKAYYTNLEIDLIEPDPDQPRKTFDEAALQELAASITANGVIVPIKVRPHAKKAGKFMLVAGERRWRAAKIAKLAEVPTVVEQLDDLRALDQQIIENSHREGVPPLEEADSYVLLMKKFKLTEEQLIKRTGRSKAYLWGRMKLLELVPYAMKLVKLGALPPAHAELIARVDPKLQEQLTKEAFGEGGYDVWEVLEDAGIQHETIAEEDGKGVHNKGAKTQLLSYRALKLLIRRRYMTKLALAKFDPTDASLVASAGACTTCPSRSGNQPELPGVTGGKGDDLCTKPSCFEAKTKAAWKVTAAAAKERGLKVIEGKDAANVFSHDGVTVASGSPYVSLDSDLPWDLTTKPDQKFGKLLGKAEAEVERVLVQDGTGAPRELLVKTAAVKKLTELGKIDKPKKPSSSSSGSPSVSKADREREEAREKKKRALHEGTLLRILDQVATNATKDPGGKELAMWRWLARAAIGEYANNELVEQRRGGFGNGSPAAVAKGFVAIIDKAKNVAEVRSFLMEYLMAEAADRGTGSYPSKHHKELFDDGCKVFGADWDKAAKTAKEAYEAEEKADAAKAAKKDAAKKPAKKGKGK